MVKLGGNALRNTIQKLRESNDQGKPLRIYNKYHHLVGSHIKNHS